MSPLAHSGQTHNIPLGNTGYKSQPSTLLTWGGWKWTRTQTETRKNNLSAFLELMWSSTLWSVTSVTTDSWKRVRIFSVLVCVLGIQDTLLSLEAVLREVCNQNYVNVWQIISTVGNYQQWQHIQHCYLKICRTCKTKL